MERMDKAIDTLISTGGHPVPVHHSRRELEQWAERYRQRAGSATLACVALLDSLFQHELLDAAAIDQLVELDRKSVV